MMMGQGLERLARVPAGCVLALGGLDRAILKSATLSSSPACLPLAPMLFQVTHVDPCIIQHHRACSKSILPCHTPLWPFSRWFRLDKLQIHADGCNARFGRSLL